MAYLSTSSRLASNTRWWPWLGSQIDILVTNRNIINFFHLKIHIHVENAMLNHSENVSLLYWEISSTILTWLPFQHSDPHWRVVRAERPQAKKWSFQKIAHIGPVTLPENGTTNTLPSDWINQKPSHLLWKTNRIKKMVFSSHTLNFAAAAPPPFLRPPWFCPYPFGMIPNPLRRPPLVSILCMISSGLNAFQARNLKPFRGSCGL